MEPTDPQMLDDIMKSVQSDGTASNSTEAYYTQSFSEVLVKSLGYYVTCEFLIGTNSLVERSGILYAAGNNFMTLQEGPTGPFMVCDIYSLKFVTVYNSHVRPQHMHDRTFQTNVYDNRMGPAPRGGQNRFR